MNKNPLECWELIKETVHTRFSVVEVSFDIFLKPLKAVSLQGKELYIQVDDHNGPFVVKMVNDKYGSLFSQVLEDICGQKYNLNFFSQAEYEAAGSMKNLTFLRTINIEESHVLENSNLNSRYTFDTFVVGKNNDLAHAASVAVAESPGQVYNPLFIYGGVGLGKTHLMHSIAHYILNAHPDYKVMYVTSETFTNDLIDSIRNENSSASEFREKYRNINVLLIDDIQFIIGKERTQEEFFHTFNTLHEQKKQIIISSDKPPKEIQTLEERLRSRFEWGLIVDIQPPDYETRVAILQKKNEVEHLHVPPEIMEFIASKVHSNIRELEGAMTKVVALSKLTNRPLDLPLAETALRDILSPEEQESISPERIIKIVAEHFNLSVEDLLSSNRSKNISFPRQICMYLCRNCIMDLPLDGIGKALGGRDHTTILHGINSIDRAMKQDSSLTSTLEVLKKKIQPGG